MLKSYFKEEKRERTLNFKKRRTLLCLDSKTLFGGAGGVEYSVYFQAICHFLVISTVFVSLETLFSEISLTNAWQWRPLRLKSQRTHIMGEMAPYIFSPLTSLDGGRLGHRCHAVIEQPFWCLLSLEREKEVQTRESWLRCRYLWLTRASRPLIWDDLPAWCYHVFLVYNYTYHHACNAVIPALHLSPSLSLCQFIFLITVSVLQPIR